MTITWHSHYTCKLTTKDKTIVLDPYAPEAGMKPFRGKASIVALSNPHDKSMSHLAGIQGEPLIIDRPGEYALDNLRLYARGWHNDNGQELTIQRWHIEGLTLLHLGALNRKLEESELQELEQSTIDILLLPIGEENFTTAQAINILTVIEPRLVIPINYQAKNKKDKTNTMKQFANEMGVKPTNTQEKVIVTSRSLSPDDLQTVLLEAK